MLGKQKEGRLRHRKLKSPARNAVNGCSTAATRQDAQLNSRALIFIRVISIWQ
jgi:hypothetical protein